MHHWLTAMITLPRWFLAAMVAGAGLFALAMGYIAGYTAGRR